MYKYAIQKFQNTILKEKFFEAHEDLEEIWFPRRFENNNEIALLKGFINAAVSFELYKRKKYKQSNQVWKTYLKYRKLLFKLDPTYQNQFYQTIFFLDQYEKRLKRKSL